jgi:hypothetical protein
MNNKKQIAAFVAVTALLYVAEPGAAVEKGYLTYDTFKALTALCPEVHNPRLMGLSPAGQSLWARGQLRVPAESHLFQGDFSRTGKSASAIVIADGSKSYIVIAEQKGPNWHRTGFVPIGTQSISGFSGRTLSIGDNSFVAWDGRKYRLERGPLAIYCNKYDTAAFMGVMMKITYVGPQDESYPGLLISSFYRLPVLSEFKSHRASGVFYGNDETQTMWHLTVSPKELQEFTIALSRSGFLPIAEDRRGTEGGVGHSLSMLDVSSSNRPNYFELFLNGEEMVSLLETFAEQIERQNADAAKVLREYAKMFRR